MSKFDEQDGPMAYDYTPECEGYNGIAHDLETLRAALQRIADGQVMKGDFTHAETVVAYQDIARMALKKAG